MKPASVSTVEAATQVTSPDKSSAASGAEPESGRAQGRPELGGRGGARALEETNATAAGGVDAGAIDLQRLMTVRLIVI